MLQLNSYHQSIIDELSGLQERISTKSYLDTAKEIRDSYNVSSITDDGTGKYDVNFSTAMSDVNYSAVVDGKYAESGDAVYNTYGSLRRIATATSYVGVRGVGGTAASNFNDLTTCTVIVFGN